jgi:hypothetical protein
MGVAPRGYILNVGQFSRATLDRATSLSASTIASVIPWIPWRASNALGPRFDMGLEVADSRDTTNRGTIAGNEVHCNRAESKLSVQSMGSTSHSDFAPVREMTTQSSAQRGHPC